MERKIGEIFKDGNVTLKVAERGSCKICHYYNIDCTTKTHISGLCTYGRSDKTPVCFIKVQ